MSQGAPVSIRLEEDDPAHAETIQRAFLDCGMKTEVRVAGTLQEAQDD